MNAKVRVKQLLSHCGLEIRRAGNSGYDPLADMRRLCGSIRRPLVIDAGANDGKTIAAFRDNLDDPTIHAFEPGRTTFTALGRQTAGIPNLHLNNLALGSERGCVEFIENSKSDMSSILEPSVECKGTIQDRYPVDVTTLDAYCAERNILAIDILKSDTQGFDLEVIKGGKNLLADRRIHLIYMEITFCDMYKGLPRADEIFGFLFDHGFSLVAFYNFYHRNDLAAWCDVLVVNRDYQGNRRV
jgi:FkbM family methyltransferase